MNIRAEYSEYSSCVAAVVAVLILLLVLLALGGSSSTLALDTASTATTVWRSESEVDVLLGVETDNERGNVDNLLANAIWEFKIPK